MLYVAIALALMVLVAMIWFVLSRPTHSSVLLCLGVLLGITAFGTHQLDGSPYSPERTQLGFVMTGFAIAGILVVIWSRGIADYVKLERELEAASLTPAPSDAETSVSV